MNTVTASKESYLHILVQKSYLWIKFKHLLASKCIIMQLA